MKTNQEKLDQLLSEMRQADEKFYINVDVCGSVNGSGGGVVFGDVSKVVFVDVSAEVVLGCALLAAVDNNCIDVVKLLIDKNVDVNVQDKNGSTALHYAAISGNVDIVRLLLDAKAKTDIKDKSGYTAFSDAECFENYEISDLLKKSV